VFLLLNCFVYVPVASLDAQSSGEQRIKAIAHWAADDDERVESSLLSHSSVELTQRSAQTARNSTRSKYMRTMA